MITSHDTDAWLSQSQSQPRDLLLASHLMFSPAVSYVAPVSSAVTWLLPSAGLVGSREASIIVYEFPIMLWMCKLPLAHFFGDLYKLLKNYGKHPGRDLPEKYRKITGGPLRPRRKYLEILWKITGNPSGCIFPVIFCYFLCMFAVIGPLFKSRGCPRLLTGDQLQQKYTKNTGKLQEKYSPTGFR